MWKKKKCSLTYKREYLLSYPICDGIYILSLLKEYTLEQYFNINSETECCFYFYPMITFFEYEKHVKVDDVKSQFLNVAINIQYSYYYKYYYYYYDERIGECIINNITINKKDIILGQFQSGITCDENDKYFIEGIINESKEFIIQYFEAE